MYHRLRQAGVIAVSLLLILSGISPVSMAAPSDDQYQPVTDSGNVTIWERAILPLRADSSNAATQIPNLNLFVNVPELSTGDVPANRETVGVYNQDQTITLNFRSREGAGTGSFANEDVKLLVAKANATSDIPSDDDTTSSMPLKKGLDLLSPQNENVTYELLSGDRTDVDGDGHLDENGEISLEYDLSEQMQHGADRGAGKYVFFLVQGDGFEVSQGDLSVTGDASVIGVDGALVQRTSASVNVPDEEYTTGDSLSFTVDANLNAEGPTNHAIILYRDDESKSEGFSAQRAVIEINEKPSGNLSAEDITIRRSIEQVNGVAKTDGNVSVLGRNINDGSVSQGVGTASLIEWISEKAGTTTPSEETLSPTYTLHASATANQTQSDTTTLTVETLSNWSAGTYRYVYVSSSENGSEISTETGEQTIYSSDYTPGDGDGDDGSDGDDGTDGDDGDDGDSGDNGDDDDDRRGGGGGGGGGGAPAPDPDDGGDGAPDGQPDIIDEVEEQINENDRSVRLGFRSSPTLSEIEIRFSGPASGTTRIEELSTLPTDISPPTQNEETALSQFQISVPTDLQNQPATLRLTINTSKVTGDPSTLTVHHYNETTAEWEPLETTFINQSNGTITVEATTPGFSLFTITQEVQQQETPDEPQTTPTDPQTTSPDGQQDDLQDPPQDDSNDRLLSSLVPVLGFILLALLAGLAYVIYRQKE